MLRYKKTLDIVEKFMVSSRIREYCTNICKGNCCNGCYESNKQACHRQEGRRLSCSIYICAGLYNYLPIKNRRILVEIRSIVLDQYMLLSNNDAYFEIPSKKFFEKSRFSSKIIHKLNRNMTKEINTTMTELINKHQWMV